MTNTSRDLGALSGPLAGAAGMLSPLSLIIGPAVRLNPAARTSGLVVTGVSAYCTADPARPDWNPREGVAASRGGWHGATRRAATEPFRAMGSLVSEDARGGFSPVSGARRAVSAASARVPAQHTPPVWSAESAVMERADRRAVLAAVARLPRRQREVLALRYYLTSASRKSPGSSAWPGDRLVHGRPCPVRAGPAIGGGTVSGIEDLLRDAYQEAARSGRPEHVRPAVVLPRARDQRRSGGNPGSAEVGRLRAASGGGRRRRHRRYRRGAAPAAQCGPRSGHLSGRPGGVTVRGPAALLRRLQRIFSAPSAAVHLLIPPPMNSISREGGRAG
jgi:hypothetical protein